MALAPGSTAPSFQLESSDGGSVSSADLAGKIVVLYFYPRDNTPGCTIEAQEFRDHLAQFRDAGAVVFGISRDSIASHCKFRDKFGLTFPLLSDADGSMMERFGAWGEKVMYGKKVTGIIRSTVVIDQQGKISRHWPKVVVKGHAAKVLEHVQSLGGAREGGGKTAKAPAKADTKDEGAPAKGKQTKAAKPAPKAAPKPAPKAAPKPAPKAAPKSSSGVAQALAKAAKQVASALVKVAKQVAKAPAKAAKAPAKAAVKVSKVAAKPAAKKPAPASGKAPAKAPSKAPAKAPSKAPAKAPSKAPAKAPSKAPAKAAKKPAKRR